MKSMLVVVFDAEASAKAATQVLREFDRAGGIMIHAMKLISSDVHGRLSLKAESGQSPVGTAIGFVLGSIIGLIGGPVGVATGAVVGTLVGMVSDHWMIATGPDWVDEAKRYIKPGHTAVVLTVEEDWLTPVDFRMEAAGGVLFRHTPSEVVTEHLNADIAAFQFAIRSLEQQVSHPTGVLGDKRHAETALTKERLESALQHMQQQAAAPANTRRHPTKRQLGQAAMAAQQYLKQSTLRVMSTLHAQRQRLSVRLSMASQSLIGRST